VKYPFARFVYRMLLRLTPRELRESYSEEMERLFVETLEMESERDGRFAHLRVVIGAVFDLLSWTLGNRTRGGWRGSKPVRSPLGFDGLRRDAFYALRSLRHSPAFSAIAVLTLALGLGGSVAIFSVVDHVLLRPLPFPEPSELYTVWETNVERGRTKSLVSPPTFVDWKESAESFSQMSALSVAAPTLSGGDSPERISGMMASPNIFELLSVPMLLGGSFPSEADAPRGGNLVVLSFGLWQSRFGSRHDAIGQTLDLDDETYTVVGVLPSDFQFPQHADVWMPLTFQPDMLGEGMRGARYLEVIARLRQGVTEDQAKAEMSAIARSLGESHPNNAGWDASLVGLRENLVLEYRSALFLLLFATLMVLVIACVNVVNLVLVRAMDGKQEKAVRLALGATGWRLFRQSLVQHTMLAVLGGLVGALIASWAVPSLIRLAPAELPRIDDVVVDARVLATCVLASVAVGCVLGVVSSLTGTRVTPGIVVRANQIGGAPARQRNRRALMVLEVALSLVLLIGAGLLIRSFVKLQNVDPGFSTSGITTASISLPRSRYETGPQRASLFRDVIERLAQRQQVSFVGATTNLPLSGSAMSFGFSIDGRPDATLNEQLSAEYHAVTPGYFRTMGIALRAGRPFEWIDDRSAPQVVIVNETMARRYWPDEDPVGKRLTVVSQGGPTSREIVGVIADVRHGGLATLPRVEVYVPLSQDPWSFATLVVRAPEGIQVSDIVRADLASLDAALPLGSVLPIEGHVARWLAPLQFQSVIVALFAASALVLSALGIYGVISYIVSLSTNEIGVRMALGAHPMHVFGSVVGQGVGLAAGGTVLGVAGALLATRFLSGLLFEISPFDPVVFTAVPALVVAVALLACFLPARRAVRVDPVAALREV